MTADWYLVVIRHKFSAPTEITTTLGRALDIISGAPGQPKRDASVFDRDGNELTIDQLKALQASEM